MIKLVKIDKNSLRFYVKLAFGGDMDLLEKYHISPGTLDHCANHTMGFIEENTNHYKDDIEFYAVVLDFETPIGYTVLIKNEKAPHELYSFGIKKEYRTAENLKGWLNAVREQLKTPYYIVLWSKNDRAINFFERNEFIVQRTSKLLDDEMKTLITTKDLIL